MIKKKQTKCKACYVEIEEKNFDLWGFPGVVIIQCFMMVPIFNMVLMHWAFQNCSEEASRLGLGKLFYKLEKKKVKVKCK